jgi:hypothetical protein
MQIWDYPGLYTGWECGTASGSVVTFQPNSDFLSSTKAPAGGETTVVTIENIIENPTVVQTVSASVSVASAPSQQQSTQSQGPGNSNGNSNGNGNNGNGNTNGGGTEIAGNPGSVIEVNPPAKSVAGLRACGRQNIFDVDVICFFSVIIYITWF